MSATASISLDTRRMKKKDGKYPVKLLVVFNSEPKRYQTIFDLTQQEFYNLSASRISDNLRMIRDYLKKLQRNAEDSISGIDPFDY